MRDSKPDGCWVLFALMGMNNFHFLIMVRKQMIKNENETCNILRIDDVRISRNVLTIKFLIDLWNFVPL